MKKSAKKKSGFNSKPTLRDAIIAGRAKPTGKKKMGTLQRADKARGIY